MTCYACGRALPDEWRGLVAPLVGESNAALCSDACARRMILFYGAYTVWPDGRRFTYEPALGIREASVL